MYAMNIQNDVIGLVLRENYKSKQVTDFIAWPSRCHDTIQYFLFFLNRIGGVMVNVLASSAVDCGFEPRSGQTKDYEIGICCFSAEYARNQDNMFERDNMSVRGLLFQWASTIKSQLSMLV